MTSAVQEPCDRAWCHACSARTCTGRDGTVPSAATTAAPVLIPEQALTVRRGYYDSDDHIDGNGC